MKRLLRIITLLLISLTLASCVSDTTYKVNFDSDGGSIVDSIDVLKGEIVRKPEDPIKEDYKFLYWSLNDEQYNFNEEVVNDITLKAIWEELVYVDVTFDSANGSLVEKQSIAVGSKVKRPSKPKKDGFNFLYWTLKDSEYNFNNIIEDSINLVAKWELKTPSELIIDTDYKPLADTVANLDFNFNIPNIIVKDENNFEQLTVNNIKINGVAKTDLSSVNMTAFLHINIKIDEVKIALIKYNSFNIDQYLFVKDGNIYSKFEGTYKTPLGKTHPISNLLETIITILSLEGIANNLPEDLIDNINKFSPLIENYQEYQEEVIDINTYNDLYDLIENLGHFIELILMDDNTDDLPFDFINNNGILEVILSEELENVIINEFLLNVVTKDGKFNEILGNLDLIILLNETNQVSLMGDLELTIDNEIFIIDEDFSEYEKVDQLKLTKLIENMFVDSII